MATIPADLALANKVINQGKKMGLGHLQVQQILENGKKILVNNKKLTSFSHCGYLGLEFDPRLLKGSEEGARKFGSHFACSRSYLEVGLFNEAEHLLSQIFNKPTIIAPSTTLAHISVIPVLAGANDAIIMDHRVHNSVNNAVGISKSKGAYVEVVRHNRMDMLESRIKKLQDKYEKIWYMADGVYSMLGDTAPVGELYNLLDKYERFYCYYDDAHGMSWTGVNGCGYVLTRGNYHSKMIVVTSLGKGFGVLGGAIVCPNEEIKTFIRNVGSTIMFSSPSQPATLGAIIESAKIHLSKEISQRQQKLKNNINYCLMTAKGLNLPLICEEKTPIFYIALGSPEICYDVSKNVINDGFFINSVVYPAVPYKDTGLRITVTYNHEQSDIYELLNSIATHLDKSVKDTKLSKEEIVKGFSMA